MKNLFVSRFATVTFFSALMAGSALAAGGYSESNAEAMHPGEGRSAMMPEIGVYGGMASQNGSQYNNGGAFQVEVGITPAWPLNLALQAEYNPSTLDIPFAKVNFNTTNVVVKATVSLGSPGTFLGDSYLGAKTGITTYSGDVESATHAAVGPTLGFDIPLSRDHHVSLGAEGTYLAVLGDDVSTPDQTSVLGALKYWF